MAGEGSQNPNNDPTTNLPRVPDSFQYAPVPIEVWQEDDAGVPIEVSDRIAAKTLVRGMDGQGDKATFVVILDELREPMVDASGGNFQSDFLARAQEMIRPDRRVFIVWAHPSVSFRQVLFVGYPRLSTVTWSQTPQGHNQGVYFEADGMLDRWRGDVECQIVGRWVHGNYTDENGSVQLNEENLRLVETQPCCFNENGKPNCWPVPINVTFPLGEEELHVPLYVFAPRFAKKVTLAGPGNTVEPVKWTYARAIVYLLWFYGVRLFANNAHGRPVEMPSPLLRYLIEQHGGAGSLLNQEAITNPLAQEDPRAGALLSAPDSAQCDRTSLREALTLLLAGTRLHLHTDYEVTPAGSAAANGMRARLDIWAET